MAATKLACLFLNRKHRETMVEQRYETEVWMTKMTGMMARSVSFSAVSCEANFVNTIRWSAAKDVPIQRRRF